MCAAVSAARSASSIRIFPTPSSRRRPTNIAATGADTLLAGDLGCLMNMAGKLQREGKEIDVRHVAEVLAGMTDAAADRPVGGRTRARRMERVLDLARSSRRTPARRSTDHDLQKRAEIRRSQISSRAAAKSPTSCRSSRRCATAARDIKNHTLAHLDLYLEAWESSVSDAGRQGALRRDGGGRPRDRARPLPQAGAKTVTKGKSMIGEEIAINDFLEAQRHHAGRNRSRRIHHPAPPRTAVAHHRAGGASQRRRVVEADFRRVHTHLDADRDLRRARRQLLAEARARCATVSWRPMSASPAPIS